VDRTYYMHMKNKNCMNFVCIGILECHVQTIWENHVRLVWISEVFECVNYRCVFWLTSWRICYRPDNSGMFRESQCHGMSELKSADFFFSGWSNCHQKSSTNGHRTFERDETTRTGLNIWWLN
jgi:hypothetical protein